MTGDDTVPNAASPCFSHRRYNSVNRGVLNTTAARFEEGLRRRVHRVGNGRLARAEKVRRAIDDRLADASLVAFV